MIFMATITNMNIVNPILVSKNQQIILVRIFTSFFIARMAASRH